ncbi:MAG TPA: acetate uptake transporter [Caulobacteraceae bacterium]|nr:acetate uptake transporter [Caulobacteraceae bacterium]
MTAFLGGRDLAGGAGEDAGARGAAARLMSRSRITGEDIAMPDTPAPAANPAALGLVGFGLTTVLLSLTNAGVLPAGGEAVVMPMALAYGGLIQIIAGLLEFRLGNTFGMTAFLSYGAFWWWFALLGILGKLGLIDLSGAGPTVGVALILWGVLLPHLLAAVRGLHDVVGHPPASWPGGRR